MAIEFVCPACGGTLQVGDESAGRVIRCGACMTALRVPAADPAAAPDPAPPAAPDPYHNGRAFPASPPPRRTPEPTDVDPLPEPPAAARPVAPPRRDRERDRDDRPRERRSRRDAPPPAPGYGVFFWLVAVGAVLVVGVVGCCGGMYFLLPGPQWYTHRSEPGKFQVDLPGPLQADVEKGAGVKLNKDEHSEGAMVARRAEQYVVIYRDVKATKERLEPDDRVLDDAVKSLQTALGAPAPKRAEPVTVGGFPGREVEVRGRGGLYTARVVVADTRVFVVFAGGPRTKAGSTDVRKFLDSFEITDRKLVAEGNRRAEQARLAAEAAQEAKDRADKRKAKPPGDDD